MTVEPIVPAFASPATIPDEPLPTGAGGSLAGDAGSFAGAVGRAFANASASLGRAERAEAAFASGHGGLQEMVLQRAQADVALSLASAAASRAAQALSTILGMAV